MFDFLFTALNRKWTVKFFGNLFGCALIGAPLYYIFGVNIGLYVIWSTIVILIVGGVASIVSKLFER
jgi:branched-subunit amino acid ABC-type transport system permease component